MRRNWWDNMDLTAWCGDGQILAGVGMDFAQAVARERARRRNVRQKLIARPRLPGHPAARFDVTDAPEVTEPCS